MQQTLDWMILANVRPLPVCRHVHGTVAKLIKPKYWGSKDNKWKTFHGLSDKIYTHSCGSCQQWPEMWQYPRANTVQPSFFYHYVCNTRESSVVKHVAEKTKILCLNWTRHNRRLVLIILMPFECFACHVTENNSRVFTVKSIWHDA